MSFSEKYRGTEWGSPAEPTPGPGPQPQPGGGGGLLLPIVAVAVVVAVIGAGAFVLLGSTPSGAGPQGRDAGAFESASSPTATPEPTVLELFTELMSRQPPLPMRLRDDIHLQSKSGTVRLVGDTNIQGSDSAGRMAISGSLVTGTLDFVIKKGRTYVREPGGPWRLTVDDVWASFNFTPRSLTTAALVDEGVVERDGRSVHRLVATRFPSEMRRVLTAQPSEWHVEVYVSEKGHPVAMEVSATFTESASLGGETVTLSGKYEISRLGKPVTITAPEV